MLRFKTIRGTELRELIYDKTGTNVGAAHLSDDSHFLLHKDDVRAFRVWDDTDKLDYAAEMMDCDDFSAVLRGRFVEWAYKVRAADRAMSHVRAGWAFGFLSGVFHYADGGNSGGPHSMCFFVDTNRELWVIEPQAGGNRLQKLNLSMSDVYYVMG